MIKRDNHYVPHSYLKRWADGQGSVWAYRLLVPHQNEPEWKRHSPKSLGYHKHLYTRMAAGGESDEIERWFETEFETPAARALQRAVSDQPLSRDDWRLIIRFLAAQDVRTPARMLEQFQRWRASLPALLDQILTESVRKLEAAKRAGIPLAMSNLPAGTEELFPARTFIKAGVSEDEAMLHVEATIGRSLWLWSLKHALNKTLDVLSQHRWTILSSPPGTEWLTSDNPVIRLNYENATSYDFKGGWGSQGTTIFMPLSPTHLLFTEIRPEFRLERGTVVSSEFAAQIQRFTVEHAHRYVFGQATNSNVVLWRPRTVSNEAFRSEAEQWRVWNAEQSAAERVLLERRTT